MARTELRVDGRRRQTDASPDTPLLYVLTDELGLKGPRFGCGLAQCGSCSVLADGVEIRSCVTPISEAKGRSITTLEGLPAWHAAHGGRNTRDGLHPVQQAMVDTQAIQCGYCFNGMIIKAAELLSKTPDPSEAEIRGAMNGHICRCGAYPRIVEAILKAAEAMNAKGARA
jgi:aerobic-type carbon monoxide dehydrogenase small subunit (CoxS/CutS family)